MQPVSQTLFSAWLHTPPQAACPHPLIEDLNGPVPDAEFKTRALAVARLCQKFSKPGDAVAVMLPNAAGTLAVFLGLSAARRVPAMVNFTSGIANINASLKLCDARILLTSRQFIEQANLQKVAAAIEGVQICYVEDLRASLTSLDRLWIAAARLLPTLLLPQADTDSPAAIIFTSGSEGRPKGVVLSHRAILINIEQVLAVIPLDAHDRFFCNLPVNHSFGLTVGALAPLIKKFAVFLYPSPLHYQTIPGKIRETRSTILLSTNTFLVNYARHAEIADLQTLRYVIAGAEKLKTDIARLWREKFNIEILEGYGCSECAPVVACNIPGRIYPGTVGPLVPGMEAQFEAIPGIPHMGVLHVRGPNLMTGYLTEDQPGSVTMPVSVFGPGWYSTGDIADLDANGCLVLHGRLRRFAKVAGEMVSLEAIERIAYSLSSACLHAVVAVADAARGERIVLITADADLSREALVNAVHDAGQSPLLVPRRILHVEELPVLGSGKPDYGACKQLAEALAADAGV